MTDNGARAPENGHSDPDATVSGPAAAETAADPAEAAAKEAAEFRDRWMRAMAEMENLRRRTEREVADARAYGITGFARDMVGVADNMRRALEAVPPELRTAADAGVKALIEGVELTERELAKAMEKHGVRRLDPKGQKFDPNFHQAMFEIPDAAVPAGTVVQIMQDGYVIGERVLRPALVGVAKGGPKETPSVADSSQEAGSERPQG